MQFFFFSKNFTKEVQKAISELNVVLDGVKLGLLNEHLMFLCFHLLI